MLIFILASCGASSIRNTTNRPLFEILTQQNDGGASIRFYEILTEPDEIKMLQNDVRLKNKIDAFAIQNSNFIILNMGEKPTIGSSIWIENVQETDTNIIITLKETIPELNANTPVSQTLTNPFCVVKVNSKKQISIK